MDWDNPGDSNFAGVKVMYRMDGHPMSWYYGIKIYSGTKNRRAKGSYQNDITYYYAIYSENKNYYVISIAKREEAYRGWE